MSAAARVLLAQSETFDCVNRGAVAQTNTIYDDAQPRGLDHIVIFERYSVAQLVGLTKKEEFHPAIRAGHDNIARRRGDHWQGGDQCRRRNRAREKLTA